MKEQLTLSCFVERFRLEAEEQRIEPSVSNEEGELKRWIQFSVPDIVFTRAKAGLPIAAQLENIREGYEKGDPVLRDWLVCGLIPSLQSVFAVTEKGESLQAIRDEIERALPDNLRLIWRHWAELPSW
jgi:hypothetical protein